MVTEYIKRGYKKAYDEDGKLLYKVLVGQASPVVVEEELPLEEELPPLNLV